MGATSAKHAPPFGARRAVPMGRPAAKRAASPRGVAQRRATRFQEVAVGVGFAPALLAVVFQSLSSAPQPLKTAIYAESEYIYPNLHKSEALLSRIFSLVRQTLFGKIAKIGVPWKISHQDCPLHMSHL